MALVSLTAPLMLRRRRLPALSGLTDTGEVLARLLVAAVVAGPELATIESAGTRADIGVLQGPCPAPPIPTALARTSYDMPAVAPGRVQLSSLPGQVTRSTGLPIAGDASLSYEAQLAKGPASDVALGMLGCHVSSITCPVLLFLGYAETRVGAGGGGSAVRTDTDLLGRDVPTKFEAVTLSWYSVFGRSPATLQTASLPEYRCRGRGEAPLCASNL